MSKIPARILKILGPIVAVTVVFLIYIGVIGDNFRVISEGKVYRSKQMDYEKLSSYIVEKKFKSILNLRPGNMGDEYYREELRAAADHNIKHFDVFMTAVRIPPPEQLMQLLGIFDSAEYPLLLHCAHGADRSGLAGVLYQVVYEGKPLEEAEDDQLTWRYGHFSFGQAAAMGEFFDLYTQHAKGKPLRKWIEEDYANVYAAQPK